MEETHAIIGILLIVSLSLSLFFVLAKGATGNATQNYVACCCNILAGDTEQLLIRSQVQTFEQNCSVACQRYAREGKVFPQNGLCVYNP